MTQRQIEEIEKGEQRKVERHAAIIEGVIFTLIIELLVVAVYLMYITLKST